MKEAGSEIRLLRCVCSPNFQPKTEKAAETRAGRGRQAIYGIAFNWFHQIATHAEPVADAEAEW